MYKHAYGLTTTKQQRPTPRALTYHRSWHNYEHRLSTSYISIKNMDVEDTLIDLFSTTKRPITYINTFSDSIRGYDIFDYNKHATLLNCVFCMLNNLTHSEKFEVSLVGTMLTIADRDDCDYDELTTNQTQGSYGNNELTNHLALIDITFTEKWLVRANNPPSIGFAMDFEGDTM